MTENLAEQKKRGGVVPEISETCGHQAKVFFQNSYVKKKGRKKVKKEVRSSESISSNNLEPFRMDFNCSVDLVCLLWS